MNMAKSTCVTMLSCFSKIPFPLAIPSPNPLPLPPPPPLFPLPSKLLPSYVRLYFSTILSPTLVEPQLLDSLRVEEASGDAAQRT
jgi:hypothetical protein